LTAGNPSSGRGCPGHGDPDLAGKLGGQLVELQGCEQAEDGLRRPRRHDGQAFVFRERGIGEPVEAAAGSRELAAGGKTGEVDPGDAKLGQITGAQQALLLGEQQEPIRMVGRGKHCATLCY
jgi:hypothetical protein